MKTPPVHRSSLLAALAAAVLAGCGGHGNPGPATKAPTIKTQPTATTAALGDPATFSVSASSEGTITYQWFHGTQAISGATSSTYTIEEVTSASLGAYSVQVTNDFGTTTSSTVTLSLPDTGAPKITAQPQSVVVNAGAATSFSVTATGDALTYQWFKNGVAIDGATSASYAIAIAGAGDEGSYYVRVTNANGSVTSSTATLAFVSATSPVITTTPGSRLVRSGASTTLTVVASGKAPLSYQWYKDGAQIAGANSASFVISPASTGSAGLYHVTVTNDLGSATSADAGLTVYYKPVITAQPSSPQTANQGQSVTLSVTANDRVLPNGTVTDDTASTTNPTTYKWYKSTAPSVVRSQSRTLTLSSVLASDAGQYYVVVSNDAGSTQSNLVTLNVITKPTITVQPGDLTKGVGQQATFTVTATNGGGTLSYKWFKNNVEISGATNASYTTPALLLSDSGATFYVEVSNSAGTTTSRVATLTVIPNPTITTQPTSVIVTAPTAAGFSVTATGTGTLTYQWYFNGNVLADGANGVSGSQTNTLSINPTSAANAGQYYVIVTDSGVATTTSATVTLTVQ